jgi:hypothetical protein
VTSFVILNQNHFALETGQATRLSRESKFHTKASIQMTTQWNDVFGYNNNNFTGYETR